MIYFQFLFGSPRLTCTSGRVWVNLSMIYACLCTFPFCSFAIFASRTSQSGWSSLLSTPTAVASATLPLSRTLARSQKSGHIPNSSGSDSRNLQWQNTIGSSLHPSISAEPMNSLNFRVKFQLSNCNPGLSSFSFAFWTIGIDPGLCSTNLRCEFVFLW